MKRSEINAIMRESLAFLGEMRFLLPPFATWTPDDWRRKGPECREIITQQLGWDITDFGSGDFARVGLFLFTLRNGNPGHPGYAKSYAEKIMVVRENQVTPMHFHWNKMEDIINRGGGVLVLELYGADPDSEEQVTDRPVVVSVDGIRTRVEAGGCVRLGPGQSICLEPYLYHRFWGEDGMVLTGEVSQVNDDTADNRFKEPCGRFPDIEEDEPPTHLLCTEYPPA